MSETAVPLFVLGAALPVFQWTVKVPIPGDDDYRFASLPLNFQAVEQDELDRMRGEGLPAGEKLPTEEQIARRVVVGWPSLTNAQGQAVPFSDEALGQLLKSPMVRQCIVFTYFSCMSGTAARKNA